jgi:perosamine synthetase
VPVFADVDDVTLNLTPRTVEARLTPRTRAVIVVDQAGVPADLDAIRALCEPRGIKVLEDAACAIGSTYRGRPVGAGAEVAAFSFHPRKLLTTGEGGMIVTSSPDVARRLRRLREHGMDVSAADRHASRQPKIERYLELGFNFRMTDIQAAIGLIQLGKVAQLISRRRMMAHRYQQMLATMPGFRTIVDPPYGTTNYQSFWVLLPDDFPISRDLLLQNLAEAGVSARRGIMAAHLEPAYRDILPDPLPVTERLTARTVILPLFHELTESEQELVVSVIAAAGRPTAPAGARA